MKKEFRFLRSGMLATGLLATLPAAAATYYCDNDRAASQYPSCRVDSSSNWTYYSGQSHDYNGDDRRARSGGSSTYYNWIFKRSRYSAAVYLDNLAFTDPRADYELITPSVGGAFTQKIINQNTASAGWHAIGTADFDTIAVVSDSASGGYILGADGAKVSTAAAASAVTADAATPGSSLPHAGDDVVDTSAGCGAIASQADPQIAAIQQKMLNAPSNYRDVAGRFRVFFANSGQDDSVDFQVSEAQGRSTVRSTDGNGGVTETAFDGSTFVLRHPLEKSYRSTALAAGGDADIRRSVAFATDASLAQSPRFYRNGRCEAVFVHRQDPAHAASAAEVTDPQNYAFWLYDSPSRVVGHVMLLGRAVTVVEGRQDDYLRRKLGAATFTLWVDDATGIVLKLVGRSATGRTAYFIEASSIAIDRGLQLAAHVADVPADWTPVE